jgi:hypothetical protein
MFERDAQYRLNGRVDMGDAYLGGELSGAYHAFGFAKYASRYLGAFAYRFNRRFRLDQLPKRLLNACIGAGPCSGLASLS